MTVPALTTSDIATFAYYLQTGCTYVQLADVLPVLHSYQQYAEYVDGTIKIFDSGSESPSPDNYVLVNVRVRADGWIMAWFPRTLMTGTADGGSSVTVTDTGMQITRNGETSASAVAVNELAGYIFKPTSGDLFGNEYCIQSNTTTTIQLHRRYGSDISTNIDMLGAATYEILQSRGNLIWWGHTSHSSGNPTSQSTRLGRALYDMWEQLKANQQGGSGAALGYGDVGYWDYEYTSSTHLYIFGHSGANTGNKYYYYTIPTGVTLYNGVMNYGFEEGNTSNCDIIGSIESVNQYTEDGSALRTYGYVNIDQTSLLATGYGIQKTIRHYVYGSVGINTWSSQAIILLTSG